MFDLEEAISEAHCQITDLQDAIDMEDGTIAKVKGYIVTIDLPDDSSTEINLGPIQRLIDGLRKMDR